MKVFGITGGISSGKSFVSNYLKSKGFIVLCSDEITSHLLLKNNSGYLEVIREFPDILNQENQIDKKKLAEIIFNDKNKRLSLNSIMHPLVKNKLIEKINEYKMDKTKLIFLDIPLLYEASFEHLCDEVIVVYCTKEKQISRLIKRDNISLEYALKKINAQLSLEEKIKKSNFVIDNSFSKKETINSIKKIINEVN